MLLLMNVRKNIESFSCRQRAYSSRKGPIDVSLSFARFDLDD